MLNGKRNCKKIRKIKLVTSFATVMAVSVLGASEGLSEMSVSVLGASEGLSDKIVNEITTIESAEEIEDDDPGRERLSGILIQEEVLGISSYVQNKMSLDGYSPFMPNTPYFHSDVFEGKNVVHGIDVSKYQPTINWNKVAKAGVDYAIIRVGYRGYGASGGMGADTHFVKHIEGAISEGVDVGVYFFSQAITEKEAIQEAEYVLKKIAGYPITMPVVFDFEYATVDGKLGGRLYNAKLTKQQATAICMAFCKTIENAGYVPMVYANPSLLNNNLNASEISSKYKIWLANYTSMTAYKGTYDFWQYTEKGKVDGISGNVDCNFWYQDPQEPILGVIPNYGNGSNNNQTGGNTGNTGNSGNNTGNNTQVPDVPVVEKVVEQVTGVTSTERTNTQLNLVWSALTDVTGYEVYRYNENIGAYELIQIIQTPAINTYVDTDLHPGTNYTYMVRAFSVGNTQEITYGDYSEQFLVATAPKTVTGFSSSSKTTTRIRLNWDWEEKVTGYEILRYNVETKQFETIKKLDSATTTWVDTNLEPGKEYEYIIKTYITDSTGTYWSDATEAITVKTKSLPIKVAKVENFYVSIIRKDKLRLNWQQVEGADGYRIYRYNTETKEYEKVKTVTSGTTLTWVNSNLESAKEYSYIIKAYIRNETSTYWSDEVEIITAKTLPKKVEEFYVSISRKDKLRLNWQQVEGADGYCIYRYNVQTDEYEKIKTITSGTTLTWVNSKLEKSTTYQYKIKAYIQLDGTKYEGEYSKVANGKTKK